MDDLVEIGNLEEYIRESACVQLFLSKGYFQSRNCLREVRSTVMHMKPIILCHEADPAKGGLKLKESSNECLPELRPFVFTTVEYQVNWETGKMTRKDAEKAQPLAIVQRCECYRCEGPAVFAKSRCWEPVVPGTKASGSGA